MNQSYVDDLKSSLVVSLVALPLCLGIALASGVSLASGVLSGIVGGILVGFISNSNVSVSGPAAGLTVIVLSQVQKLGLEAFFSVVLIAGLIQILFSFLKGGRIGDLFPNAVIHGMLAAIGLTLIINQLPKALGTPLLNFQISLPHIINALITLFILFSWGYISKKRKSLSLVPSALIAVILTGFVNAYFDIFNQDNSVSIPLNIFSTLNFHFPVINTDIIIGALTIAVVASLESLLCIDAGDKLDKFKRSTNKNRELFAQGIGNTLCGLIGALPVTAVIVRTSTNVEAGARTKLSAILHGVWLLIFIVFAASLINKVPISTLAVILLSVGYKLTRPALFIKMKSKGNDQLFLFSFTIITILMTDLLKGIVAGLIITLLLESLKIRNKLLVKRESNIITVKADQKVSYLSKLQLQNEFEGLKDGQRLDVFLNKEIHSDVWELAENLHERFPAKVKLSLM